MRKSGPGRLVALVMTSSGGVYVSPHLDMQFGASADIIC